MAAKKASGAMATMAAYENHLVTHGRHIFIYNHIATGQTLYSLERSLNTSHLKRLTFAGKKTIPASIRKDAWRPLVTVEFPTTRQGLLAFRKLREFKKLHELTWSEPAAFGNGMLDLDNPYAPGPQPRPPKKERSKLIMDQKANTIADLAAVLQSQVEAASRFGDESASIKARAEFEAMYRELKEKGTTSEKDRLEAEISTQQKAVKLATKSDNPKQKEKEEQQLLGILRRRAEFVARKIKAVEAAREQLEAEIEPITQATTEAREDAEPASHKEIDERPSQEDILAQEEKVERLNPEVALRAEKVKLREMLNQQKKMTKMEKRLPYSQAKLEFLLQKKRITRGTAKQAHADFDRTILRRKEITDLLRESTTDEMKAKLAQAISTSEKKIASMESQPGNAGSSDNAGPSDEWKRERKALNDEWQREMKVLKEMRRKAGDAGSTRPPALKRIPLAGRTLDKGTVVKPGEGETSEGEDVELGMIETPSIFYPPFWFTPTGSTRNKPVPKRGPLRKAYDLSKMPKYMAEGFVLKWTDPRDAECASAWPEQVRHERAGFVRHTAVSPTAEPVFEVEQMLRSPKALTEMPTLQQDDYHGFDDAYALEEPESPVQESASKGT